MGNITGVDKYKMERVLKVNTLEASFVKILHIERLLIKRKHINILKIIGITLKN